MDLLISLVFLAVTIGIYWLIVRFYARVPWPVFHPVLAATACIVVLLVLFELPYELYMTGGQWIDRLLGPAVVALAYPLYTQRKVLVKNWKSIISGVLVSLLSGLASVYVFVMLTGLEKLFFMSMLPKSITTPVAIEVSEVLAGIPSMTVAFVMTAGFTGALLGPAVLKWSRIHSDMAAGIALGSASHGVGLSKAAERGEVALSMGSVAMTISAVLGSGLIPFIVYLFSSL